MSLHRTSLALAAVAALVFAADAGAADPPTHVIAANVNDAGIDTSRGPNLVWLAPDPARRVGKLLVFLPLGGANNLPSQFEEIGAQGGRLGYHTIVLAYKNEAPIAFAPPAGCGNGVEASTAPPNCAIDARMEMLDGRGESTVLSVDRANSIENRLNKVLVYLAATYPGEGWAQFLDTSGTEPVPKWSDTVIAGGSLGAGQATIIAAQHTVYRVSLFAGWTDAKHGWVTLGATPKNRYFALIHQRDNFFARTCYAYLALDLAPSCPLPGFSIPPAAPDATSALLVDNREPPFGTAQLVFDLDPTSHPPAVPVDPYHASTTRDGYTAMEEDGTTPSLKLVGAWRSILGDSDADTWLDQVDNCPLVANADQTDSDANGVGDVCGPTLAGGTAGATVPATLSLTLGARAGFGAFTPGVDRSYDTSTTANVISTAGRAALSVSDPAATGRLVNGTFFLAEPLQAKASSAAGTGAALAPLGAGALALLTYTGPASNDAVSVAFRQHIGATEALRAGAYTKALTFTLSTTAP